MFAQDIYTTLLKCRGFFFDLHLFQRWTQLPQWRLQCDIALSYSNWRCICADTPTSCSLPTMHSHLPFIFSLNPSLYLTLLHTLAFSCVAVNELLKLGFMMLYLRSEIFLSASFTSVIIFRARASMLFWTEKTSKHEMVHRWAQEPHLSSRHNCQSQVV